MSFHAELRADPELKMNIKYRNSPYVRGNVNATRIAVSNGSISNKNIWADNSVELGVSWRTAQESNYIIITHSIVDPNSTATPPPVIPWTRIAGEIISTEYINNNNVNISYTVDAYTSAKLTEELRAGFFNSAQGLCARTNLTYPSESAANLQPEPFSGSDMKQESGNMSFWISDYVASFTGINTHPNLIDRGYCFILWISNFAATTVHRNPSGSLGFWSPNATTAPQPNHIVNVTGNPFIDPSLPGGYQWYGSYSTGIPTVWTDLNLMGNFINAMLSNCGQEMALDVHGMGDLDSIRRWAHINNSYFTSMGSTDSTEEATEPLKQTKIITNEDILNIQIVPLQFASNFQSAQLIDEDEISTNWGLHNFNPMQDERTVVLPDGTIVHDYSKSKLMSFPYWYFKLITNIGNEIDIIPQTKFLSHAIGGNSYLYEYNLRVGLRFLGGDAPRLMIAILDSANTHGYIANGSGVIWNTIFEYPNIPWQLNVSSDQQLQAISSKLNRTSEIYSAIIGHAVRGTGFMHGFRNPHSPTTDDQNIFRQFMSMSGAGYGHLASMLGTRGTFTRTFRDDVQVSQDNLSASAGNIIASSPKAIIGEDNISALLCPPVRVLRCGMTDGELFAFARFLDRQGQATNCIINPLTNAGSVFAGNASISSVGNRTYYQFHDIDVNGTMPTIFKEAIQAMFIGGMYMINT